MVYGFDYVDVGDDDDASRSDRTWSRMKVQRGVTSMRMAGDRYPNRCVCEA
jgi:hypothetical protein